MHRILAVDDETDILSLIKNILEQRGFAVDTYTDAAQVPPEALTGYNLILLDVMMPGKDGIAYCREIRAC